MRSDQHRCPLTRVPLAQLLKVAFAAGEAHGRAEGGRDHEACRESGAQHPPDLAGTADERTLPASPDFAQAWWAAVRPEAHAAA
jgi:hypothetical protein